MWERKKKLLKFNPFKLYSLVTKFISSLFPTFLLRIMILSLKLSVYMHWTFGDDLVSSLLVTFGNKMRFIANTTQSNIYSNEIFRYYRLIKFAPSFSPLAPLFQINNNDKNYFSSLNVIIFFIISNEIHISSLNL